MFHGTSLQGFQKKLIYIILVEGRQREEGTYAVLFKSHYVDLLLI